jgi:DNA invertase Pin-like site-specific DNA recombinase
MANTISQPKAITFLREESQESADCKQAARALGAQVVREYIEGEYKTATSGIDERPTLRLMLDELYTSRDIQYVILTRPSRLTRRADVRAAILQKIEAAGTTLIFCQP